MTRGWLRVAGPARPHPDERGAGTVLAVLVVMVLASALLVGLWAAGWAASRQRAAQAADLAALAGARAQVSGRDTCRAAAEIARRNRASLVSCRIEGGVRDVVVRVAVETDLVPTVAGRPRRVQVSAVAGTVGAR